MSGVIDLSRVPPVIDERIDPRLHAIVRQTPTSVHVVFAGPDAPFLDALRGIYGVPLRCRDVLICSGRGHIIIAVSAHAQSDGLFLDLTSADDGTFFVQPALVFTPNRAPGAQARLKHDPDHANLLIAAFEDLLFRRVMAAEEVS